MNGSSNMQCITWENMRKKTTCSACERSSESKQNKSIDIKAKCIFYFFIFRSHLGGCGSVCVNLSAAAIVCVVFISTHSIPRRFGLCFRCCMRIVESCTS